MDRWENKIDFNDPNWLAPHQQEHAATGAVWGFQGLLSRQILVRQSVAQSPEDMLFDNTSFVVACVNSAFLIPGEYPLESLKAHCVARYADQASNGGHGQWAHNCGWSRAEVLTTAHGLKDIGALGYLRPMLKFVALMNGANRGHAKAILESGGFGDDAIVGAIDEEFYAAGGREDLCDLAARWLSSQPGFEPVADADLPARLEALRNANPRVDARAADIARRKDEVFHPPAVKRVLETFFAGLGRKLDGFEANSTSYVLASKDLHVWNVQTGGGSLWAVARRTTRLVGAEFQLALVDDAYKPTRVLGEMKLSRADFDTLDTQKISINMILPEGRRPFEV